MPIKAPIKAAIFDLDGTLTQPYLNFDVIRREIGLSVEDGPILEAMARMSQADRQRAYDVLEKHEETAVDESKLNPGAKKVLETLRCRGIAVGVLTRNKRENALRIAERHGLVFDAVLGRDDGPIKPDASGILSLCKTFSVDPTQTLMIGDYVHDLECARAAGAVSVLLMTHINADQFRSYADFAVENIEQILQIVEA